MKRNTMMSIGMALALVSGLTGAAFMLAVMGIAARILLWIVMSATETVAFPTGFVTMLGAVAAATLPIYVITGLMVGCISRRHPLHLGLEPADA